MMSITWPQIGKAIIETLQMVSISLLIGSLGGIPLGILLVITNNTGIIKNKLFKLDDNIIVYPGHGDLTTIGHEKKYNIEV